MVSRLAALTAATWSLAFERGGVEDDWEHADPRYDDLFPSGTPLPN